MIALRLSIMMFIQFFLWGSWYVTAYLFLGKIGFGGPEIGWTYSVGPIAGMISPFFVGMIADRFFATERVLGVMHLLGGGAMFAAAAAMGGDSPLAGADQFVVLRAYALLLPHAGADQLAGTAEHDQCGAGVSVDPGVRHDRLDCSRHRDQRERMGRGPSDVLSRSRHINRDGPVQFHAAAHSAAGRRQEAVGPRDPGP